MHPVFPDNPVLLVAAATEPGTIPPSQPLPGTRPQIVLEYSKISGSFDDGLLEGTKDKPAKLTYANELTISSQQISADMAKQDYTAQGDVHLHELDTDLWASSLDFYALAGTVNARNVRLYQQPYFLRADTLFGNAKQISTTGANFTTAPPGQKPVFHVQAKSIIFIPSRGLTIARGASFYLYGTRILQLRYTSYQKATSGAGGGGGLTRQTKPVFGVSGLYGTYAGLDVQQQKPFALHYGGVATTRAAPQLYLYASQNIAFGRKSSNAAGESPEKPTPLQQLRTLATEDHGPLTYGDPLNFHDFLSDRNPIQIFNRQPSRNLSVSETATSELPSSGNNVHNLYVSRLPEVGAHVTVPITPPAPKSVDSDHASFRSSLRRFVLLAHGDVYGGNYLEQQPHFNQITHGRLEGIFKVDTQPYLIARNTVVVPAFVLTGNSYSGSRVTYSYVQSSFAVNHYFTDRTALGLQYTAATTTGSSPFNFDTLDTTREFDTRLQLGNHKFAVEGLVRYDIVRESIIGYKVAIAPSLPGVIPVLEFDSTSRSLGVNLDIEGITF
jgi:hypothetical protein